MILSKCLLMNKIFISFRSPSMIIIKMFGMAKITSIIIFEFTIFHIWSKQRSSARPSLCMWLFSLEWPDNTLISLDSAWRWCRDLYTSFGMSGNNSWRRILIYSMPSATFFLYFSMWALWGWRERHGILHCWLCCQLPIWLLCLRVHSGQSWHDLLPFYLLNCCK